MTENKAKTCVYCEQDDAETPLVVLEYRGSSLRICPQHLPLLIHDPAKLVGKLPGAEGLTGADK
jgi:hypothetical protein